MRLNIHIARASVVGHGHGGTLNEEIHSHNFHYEITFHGLVAMMMDADLKEIAGLSCKEYKDK